MSTLPPLYRKLVRQNSKWCTRQADHLLLRIYPRKSWAMPVQVLCIQCWTNDFHFQLLLPEEQDPGGGDWGKPGCPMVWKLSLERLLQWWGRDTGARRHPVYRRLETTIQNWPWVNIH
jgi:hypothetical protein